MKTIKTLSILTAVFFIAIATSFAQDEKQDSVVAVGKKVEDGVIYGNDLTDNLTKVEIQDLIAAPEKFEKQNIEVKGNVTEVCQNMGCWMMITDGKNLVKIMTLHKFFLPKDLSSVNAIAQGEFIVKDIKDADKKHYEEESGKLWKDAYGDMSKFYIIKASGVKILNK
jgi:hypothetical protein